LVIYKNKEAPMKKVLYIGLIICVGLIVAGAYFWLGIPHESTPTPTPTPTPKPASGGVEFHYKGRKDIGNVDVDKLKLSLDLVYDGSVDLSWDINNKVVKLNDIVELRTKGQGELKANLTIDGNVTLKGITKDIYVEVPLGKLLVPKPEDSLKITIPVEGIPVTITVKYRADLIHQAGISTTVLNDKEQTKPDQIVEYELTVKNPENAKVIYYEKIDLTVSLSIDAGVLGSANLPSVTREVFPEEEKMVLITLSSQGP
jgi:hypothetical protein